MGIFSPSIHDRDNVGCPENLVLPADDRLAEVIDQHQVGSPGVNLGPHNLVAVGRNCERPVGQESWIVGDGCGLTTSKVIKDQIAIVTDDVESGGSDCPVGTAKGLGCSNNQFL